VVLRSASEPVDELDVGPLLTPREVAPLLRISARQVVRLVAAGDLPAVRLSDRGIRIPRRELNALTNRRLAEARTRKEGRR
jgi:excisionase family DNA binding protein